MSNYRTKPALITIISAGILLTTITYYNINPTESYFVPKCVFKTITGYDCPSCGIQRALHAILHGEIISAIKLNPFLFLILPYLLAIVYTYISTSRLSQKIRQYTHHHITIYIYLCLYIAWWILRNTSFWLSIDS